MFRTPPTNPTGVASDLPDIDEDEVETPRAGEHTPSDTQFDSSPNAPTGATGGAIPKAADTLPSYDELKRRELEEKIGKLEKQLKEKEEFCNSIFRNNTLHPNQKSKPRRSSSFEEFELRRPNPRNNIFSQRERTDTNPLNERANTPFQVEGSGNATQNEPQRQQGREFENTPQNQPQRQQDREYENAPPK